MEKKLFAFSGILGSAFEISAVVGLREKSAFSVDPSEN